MSRQGKARGKWRSRPLFWVCVVLGAAALAGYLTRPEGRREDDELRSSFRTTPDGTAALSRAIARLGRHTEPRLTPMAGVDPVRGTIVTLQGRSILSPREIEAVLDRVRAGGTFIYAPPVTALGRPVSTPLTIALGLWFNPSSLAPGQQRLDWLDRRLAEARSGEIPDSEAKWAGHPLTEGLAPPTLPRFGFDLIPEEEADSAGAEAAAPGDAPEPGDLQEPVDPAETDEQQGDDEEQDDEPEPPELPSGWPEVTDAGPLEPIMTVSVDTLKELVGAALIPLGEGRIVVFADVEPLANKAAGEDPLAIVAVRAALEYTSEADTVFFDEFRQGITGYGSRVQVLANFFLGSPGGLTLSHVLLACFLYLACRGLRFGIPNTAVAPSDRERRSPLEHVSALGDLYRKARATNTAALLLLARLANSIRRPPPRDMDEAERLLRELEARGGQHPALERVKTGLREEPVDLTLIASGVDEQLSRRFNT
ncbi:MAG: DUF4350 domain-containing protein [Gemmatimonadota bacterium]|nr:DUF4350 domain-containing protein [Gemmatimonadota bacterium]